MRRPIPLWINIKLKQKPPLGGRRCLHCVASAKQWTCGDLNPEPPPCHGGALPIVLQALKRIEYTANLQFCNLFLETINYKLNFASQNLRPRQESNLDLELRSPLFCPLNYGGGSRRWRDS